MRKELAAAAARLDAARQALADNPKSNKALVEVIDSEENYLARRALARAFAFAAAK